MARAHGNDRDVEALDFADAAQAFLVGKHQASAGIPEAIGKLVGLPPGIHGHNDRTDHDGAHEGRDPFGIVAHGDRDAVALGDAMAGLQHGGDADGLRLHVGKGEALALVDDELLVGVGGKEEGQIFAQRLGRILEHRIVHSANVRSANRKLTTGRRDGRSCPVDRLVEFRQRHISPSQ